MMVIRQKTVSNNRSSISPTSWVTVGSSCKCFTRLLRLQAVDGIFFSVSCAFRNTAMLKLEAERQDRCIVFRCAVLLSIGNAAVDGPNRSKTAVRPVVNSFILGRRVKNVAPNGQSCVQLF